MSETTKVSITVQPIESITVKTNEVSSAAAATEASQVTFTNSGTGLTSTDTQAALQELDHRFFSQAAAPTGGTVAEGDLWYDSDDDQMYVRRGSEWKEIVLEGTTGGIDGGVYS